MNMRGASSAQMSYATYCFTEKKGTLKTERLFFLTMNVESCWRAQSPVGHVFCDTSVVGSVFFTSLDNNQVPIGGLNVVGVTFRLYLNPIFQPVNLKVKSTIIGGKKRTQLDTNYIIRSHFRQAFNIIQKTKVNITRIQNHLVFNVIFVQKLTRMT